MGRNGVKVVLGEADHMELSRQSRSQTIEARARLRADIILMAAEDNDNEEIARELRVGRNTVSRWRNRFAEGGIEALADKPRPGQPRKVSPEDEKRVLEMTLTPPRNATHWSVRKMAKAAGISPSHVHNIWKRHDLKPHIVRTFKLSNDPLFEEKVTDIVGLYMDPPENAVILSVDEKSGIQALDRSRPILPIREGLPEHQTHDYKRHGTTTLFAALNVGTGEVIHQLHERHTRQEFIAFLEEVDNATPEKKDLHIIVDNLATHKTKEVRDWLEAHPRFTFHFTPTSSSWINLVERVFSKLTAERLKRGVFRSVDALEQAIIDWLKEHNQDPTPLVWTKKADAILRKVKKYRETYAATH